MSTALVPERMTFADCARTAEASIRRHRRAQARRPAAGQRSLYKGAETSRLTLDWSVSLAPADDELRWSLPRLRARARDLARNNAYVRAYLRMLIDNVVGAKGVKLQAQVKDNDQALNERMNDKLERGWADWSRDVTIGTPLSLTAFSWQALRTIATDGEGFVRLWRSYPNRYAFALEAIDPDQIDEQLNRPRGARGEGEIRMGIEMDEQGRPVAYHAWDSPLYTVGMAPERRRLRIPASEVIHLYHPDRVDQSRGVTWFQAAMYPLKMLDGLEEAELVAARVSAAKMGFFVKKDDGAGGFAAVDAIAMEANPGSMEVLPPGYELQSFEPDHPSAQFPAFVKTQLRKIARALGVSYNALVGDLESVNYSSIRSGMLSERDTWRSLQEWWTGAFLTRIYGEWVNLAQLSGALTLDQREFSRLVAANWIPRGWAWVDPLKDMQATIQGIGYGLTSRHIALGEQGIDPEEVAEQLARESDIAAEHGIEIRGPQPQAAAAPPEDEKEDEDAVRDRRGVGRLAAALARNGGQR